jgi:hypothetical protein
MAKTPRYPSPVEHTGYYNIPPWDAGINAAPIHRSVEDVPEFDFDELLDLKAATEECLQDEGASLPPARKDYLGADAWNVLEDDVEDRTLPVAVSELRLLTPSLIFSLQRHALPRQPLWRIRLMGEDFDAQVMVYPTVVRVGDLDESVPLEKALEIVIGRVRAIREPRDGPVIRQIEYLSRAMPIIVGRLDNAPVHVAGVFDTGCQGDPERMTVWLLHAGKGPWSYEVVQPVAGYSDHFVVRSDATCDERSPRHIQQAERWCAAWYVHKGTQEIVVEGPTDYGRKRRRHVFQIDPSEILRDADLKDGTRGAR